MLSDFNSIYNEFESTKNICKFCDNYREQNLATRFLLIRSLDKDSLIDIIHTLTTEKNIKSLMEKVYNSSVTIDQLIAYINGKRRKLISQQNQKLEGLSDLLLNIQKQGIKCGVHNDKINDIIKRFVRNKDLKTIEAFSNELDQSLLPHIRQYCLWSYYNQTSNDIIELYFSQHASVIPTLRRIHGIDFFIQIGDDIIPFDLKFTHISNSYFDLASQGIIKNNNVEIYDDFCIADKTENNETQTIKDYYKHFKKYNRNIDLPVINKLNKDDLCDLLDRTNNVKAREFVAEIRRKHKAIIPTTSDQLYPLEWWNYKDQGERLFCNNNRLFVFLAYTNRFVDARELKGNTTEIGKKIKNLLDNLTKEDIHTIKYHYDKEADLIGDYTALSLSTIYSEEKE